MCRISPLPELLTHRIVLKSKILKIQFFYEELSSVCMYAMYAYKKQTKYQTVNNKFSIVFQIFQSSKVFYAYFLVR